MLGLGREELQPFKHSTAAIPSTDSNGNSANSWDSLVWLAIKAEPWMPSASELVAAFDAANLAVAVTDYASSGRRKRARASTSNSSPYAPGRVHKRAEGRG